MTLTASLQLSVVPGDLRLIIIARLMHSQRHLLTGCLQEVDLSFGCNTQPRLKYPTIYFLQALHEYSMYGQALALCYAIKPESVSACLTACVLLIISIIF